MSITNIDISFSGGGGQHQVTVTESLGQVCGPNISEGGGSLGQRLTTSNADLNSLIEGFLVESVTESSDARISKKEYKMIDSTSEILRRVVVLVRGINAPLNGGSAFEGNIFAAGEGPKNKVSSPSNNFPSRHGAYSGGSGKGYIILGGAYSSFTTEEYVKGEGQGIDEYKKNNVLYKNGTKNTNLSSGSDEKISDDKASLVYGYTPSELMQALAALGISTEGGSFTNEADVILDTSGKLQDCVSSMASFFGFYWYCKISSNPSIVFVDSKTVANMSVPNFSAGENILSFSNTTSLAGPHYVNSYMGSSQPDSRSHGGGNSGAGGGGSLGRPKYRTFKFWGPPINPREYHEIFYTFFSEKNKYRDANSFSYFFHLCGSSGGELAEEISRYTNSKIWVGDKPIYSQINAKAFWSSGEANAIRNIKGGKGFTTEDNNRFLRLSGPKSELKNLMEAPKEILFERLSNYFANIRSFYVSPIFSERYLERHSFTQDGFTLSKPIPKGTFIEKIDEMSNFVKDYPEDFAGMKIEDMAIRAGSYKVDQRVDVPDKTRSKYFILAIKTRSSDDPNAMLNELAGDEFNFLGAVIPIDNDKVSDNTFIFGPPSFADKAATAAGNSVKTFRAFAKNFLVKNRFAKIGVVKVNKEGSFAESSDPAAEADTLEEVPFENVFQYVNGSQSVSRCSEGVLQTYNGSVSEAKALAKANNLTAVSILKSSSVTYHGIRTPEISPILDSVSISFSEIGPTTNVSYSTKQMLPMDQSLLLTKSTASSSKTPKFGARAKNFFKLS